MVPDSRTRKSPSRVNSRSDSLRLKLPWNQSSFCSCCTIAAALWPLCPDTPKASSSGSWKIKRTQSEFSGNLSREEKRKSLQVLFAFDLDKRTNIGREPRDSCCTSIVGCVFNGKHYAVNQRRFTKCTCNGQTHLFLYLPPSLSSRENLQFASVARKLKSKPLCSSLMLMINIFFFIIKQHIKAARPFFALFVAIHTSYICSMTGLCRVENLNKPNSVHGYVLMSKASL